MLVIPPSDRLNIQSPHFTLLGLLWYIGVRSRTLHGRKRRAGVGETLDFDPRNAGEWSSSSRRNLQKLLHSCSYQSPESLPNNTFRRRARAVPFFLCIHDDSASLFRHPILRTCILLALCHSQYGFSASFSKSTVQGSLS